MKKIIISLSVLFGCYMAAWADVEINEENFPDENFRSWVLAKDFGNTFYYFVITPDGQYKMMHLWHSGQEKVIVNGKEYKRYDWSGDNETT